jgi:predicted transcriptional regulator
MLVGLAMLVAGGLLFSFQPRLKDTTRAMMIALKHGNTLTVTKLAIEMDISVKKAEKIIQELWGPDAVDLDQRECGRADLQGQGYW